MIAWIASSVDLGLLGGQSVGGQLAGDEIAPRDLELLVLGVAGEVDHFHAVAQRPRDVVEDVRGADEHDPRQVERHAEVIVAEGRVLLGVEHFEQRRGGIALVAAAELVDLVEHHDAVAAAGAADALQDVAGQGADIGAAMAADLGLVMRAAEADADEFAPGGARDALAQRGLADAGRPDKAQDRAAAVRVELVDRQEFENAPLDLREAVMVLVEDPARFGDVDRRLVLGLPRQFDQPFEIGAGHRVFAGRLGHAFEPRQLLLRVRLDLFRHARLVRSSRAARRFPGSWRPRPRPVPSGSSSAARAAETRAGARRWSPWCGRWIWRDRRSTSSRYDSSSEMRSSRRAIATVSRISCFSAGVMSMKLAIRSASAGAEVDALDGVDQLGRGLRQQLQHFERLVAQMEQPGVDLGVLFLRFGERARPARRRRGNRRETR